MVRLPKSAQVGLTALPSACNQSRALLTVSAVSVQTVPTVLEGEDLLLSCHQLSPPYSFAFLSSMLSYWCLVFLCSMGYILGVWKGPVCSLTCFPYYVSVPIYPLFSCSFFAQWSCFFFSAACRSCFVLSHHSDMRSEEPLPSLPPCRLLQFHFG